jgi:hypothetical protein
MTTSTAKATSTEMSIADPGEFAPSEAKADALVARRRREAAARALAEAADRRAKAEAGGMAAAGQDERSGRGGLDPVRYGDWEVKGIATDF